MKSNKWRNLAINYKNLSLLAFKLGKRNLISANLYKNIIYRYFDEFKFINQNIDKFDEFIKMSIETLKSIANIDKIIPQRLFLSSFLGDLSELNRELSNHLNISVNGFSFLDKFGGKEVINLMIAIYAKELMAKRLKADFRIFQRAKPLHQRADGKLIISLVAGAILGMIYPIYMLILALNLDLKRDNLKADLSIQNASLNSLNSDLALINNQLENLLKDKQNIKDNINLNLSKIDKISNKINNQNLAIILSNITTKLTCLFKQKPIYLLE